MDETIEITLDSSDSAPQTPPSAIAPSNLNNLSQEMGGKSTQPRATKYRCPAGWVAAGPKLP